MTARLRFTVTETPSQQHAHTYACIDLVDDVDHIYGVQPESLTAADIRMRYPDFARLFPEDSDRRLPGLTYTIDGRQWQIEPEVGA